MISNLSVAINAFTRHMRTTLSVDKMLLSRYVYRYTNFRVEMIPSVIYWLLTEPSIKRCTCVNKRKNSGSRWMLDNNITTCPDGSSQLETGCQSENQPQTDGLGPSVTHGWATQVKMRKKCCYGQKNLGQYSSLSLSPTHLSHTTNITLSRIKCERDIFI